jgi:holo-[acyl-carrier protein] synthase
VIRGVGIDLVDIDRVEAALGRTPSIAGRLWTPAEQAHCRGRVPSLAARFAAKEAVAKALGTGVRGFAFVDVEVVADELGRPAVALHDRAAEVAAAAGVTGWQLSLSTSRSTAGAVAVAVGGGWEGS